MKDVVKQVHALDDALVELNKVADLSAQQTEDLKQRAFDLAEQVGQTGEEAINAIAEVKRAGFSLAESELVAKYALMMTNVAEGIDDAGDAANILISILKGTNSEVSYAGTLLDEMNEISNNSAISFDALANMTQEIAGTMNTLGANTEETMALLTGAYEVLQDERVAKGISVIGLRIQGMTEDLEEEAGLQSKVNDALMTYAGISVFDEAGQLRNYYDILEDLSEVWDDLSKNAKAYLTTTLAGKNRADVLNALMTNWEGVSDAMQQASDSTGSALQEQENYLNSISGKLTAMKSAWQELSDTTLDSGVVKFVIDLATAIVKVSNATGGLVNSIVLVYGAVSLIKGLGIPAFLHNMIVMLNGTASAETVVIVQTNILKASIGGLALAITAVVAIVSLVKQSIADWHQENQALISDGEAIAENALKLKQLTLALDENQNVESQIVELLGKKKKLLEDLTEGTEEYKNKVKELAKEELKQEKMKLSLAKSAAQKELVSAAQNQLIWKRGNVGYANAKAMERAGVGIRSYHGSESIFGSTYVLASQKDDVSSIEDAISNYNSYLEAAEKLYDYYLETDDEQVYSAFEAISKKATDLEPYVTDYNEAVENMEAVQNALVDTASGDKSDSKNLLLDAITSIRDAIDEETKATEEATEAEQKQLEIAEKRLAVEKALQELAEAKEKRVQVFRMGQGMVYADDIDAIQTAQEALTKAQTDLSETTTATDATATLAEEVETMYNYMATTYGTEKLSEYMTEERLAGADTSDRTALLNYYKQLLASFEAQQQPEWNTNGVLDNVGIDDKLSGINSIDDLEKFWLERRIKYFNIGNVTVNANDAQEFADSMADVAKGSTVEDYR